MNDESAIDPHIGGEVRFRRRWPPANTTIGPASLYCPFYVRTPRRSAARRVDLRQVLRQPARDVGPEVDDQRSQADAQEDQGEEHEEREDGGGRLLPRPAER